MPEPQSGSGGEKPDSGEGAPAGREDNRGNSLRGFLVRWRALWGGRSPSLLVVLLSVAAAAFMTIPLFYVLYRAGLGGAEVWGRLLNTRLPELMYNTLGLTLFVTLMTIVIGVSLAWIVERTNLPGRNIWRWLLAMPLAIPPYVGGLAYITVFGPRGMLEEWVTKYFGSGAADALPDIFGFGGAAAVLILFSYPYVYLLTGAALRSINVTLEDAARILGCGPKEVFLRVTLPMIRPAVGAGGLLVALYVLSDFGAVALMRFDTFTLAIYQELTARFNREAASALSTILVAITFIILWGESRLQGKAKYYQTTGTWRPAQPIELEGAARALSLIYAGVIGLFALALPIGLLTYWASRGIGEQAVGREFIGYTLNSFGLSAVAATLAIIVALPLSYLAVRHSGFLARGLNRLSQTGYALPGVVVALSLIFIFTRFFPALYGTVAILIAAYMIRFLPQSLRGAASGLSQISPNIEDAARSLGRSPAKAVFRVTLPLMIPSLIAGWALVFLSTLKELPATLLLRPIEFDTLPIRLWAEASEGFYELASVPAVILVLVSVIPLYLILTRGRGGFSEPS